MSQQYFVKCHHHRLSDVEKTTISLLYEFINLIETITLCFLVILILFIPIFFALINYVSTVQVYTSVIWCVHLRVHSSVLGLLHEFHNK